MMKRHALCAILVTALASAACADQGSSLTLQQAIQGQSRATLGQEAPVVAVCGALRVIAQDTAAVGLGDLLTGSSELRMGVKGAASWVTLASQVQTKAGRNWMKTSQASAMFFRDWLVFSQPILENLNKETAVSNPNLAVAKMKLRGLQTACSAVYQTSGYTVIH